jgi:hypothetical protein
MSCRVVSCGPSTVLTPAGIFALTSNPADMTGHWTLSFCPSFLHCCMQAKDMYVRFAFDVAAQGLAMQHVYNRCDSKVGIWRDHCGVGCGDIMFESRVFRRKRAQDVVLCCIVPNVIVDVMLASHLAQKEVVRWREGYL